MGNSNLVEVRFGANAEGLRRGAGEAKQHVDSLLGKLREFKSEQVGQLRTAKFFANELTEIGGGADIAKGALRDLIAVGLSGGGIAMAFEGSLFVLKRLHEHFKESEEAAKKLKETSEKLDEALQKISDSFGPPKSETQKAWLAWLRPIEKEMEGLQKKIDDILEAGKLIPEIGASAAAVAAAGPGKRKDELEGLVKEGNEKRAATAAAEQRDKANKAAEEDHLKFLDRQDNAEVEAAAHFQKVWKDVYDQKTKDATDGLNKILAAVEKELSDEFAALRATREAESLVDSAVLDKDLKRTQDAAKKSQDQAKALADSLGGMFAHTFTNVIMGVQSIGDAFDQLGQRLLEMALQGILQSLFGGFMSVLGIGGGGGGGGFLSLVSSAGGLDRVPVAAMPAILHKDETVLPASLAEAYRRGAMALQGGGDSAGEPGGGEVHTHFHLAGPIDGDSFRRFVESPYFARAMREAHRNGLVP